MVNSLSNDCSKTKGKPFILVIVTFVFNISYTYESKSNQMKHVWTFLIISYSTGLQ